MLGLLPSTLFVIFLSSDKKPRVCPVSIPRKVLTSSSSGSRYKKKIQVKYFQNEIDEKMMFYFISYIHI